MCRLLEEALHVLADARARVLVVGPEHAPAVLDQSVDLPDVQHIVVIGEDSDRGYENLLAKGALQGPDVAVADDAPAVLHYTSGSSGRLKAAVQTFGNRMALVRKSLMLPPPSRMTLLKVARLPHPKIPKISACGGLTPPNLPQRMH